MSSHYNKDTDNRLKLNNKVFHLIFIKRIDNMNKKLILFLIVLISLCAVSYASAADDGDLIAQDNTDMETQAVDGTIEIEESSQDDVKLDSNDNTYRNIQREIDAADEGATIYLNGTYYCDYLINVNKTINIVGMGDGAEIRYNSSKEYTTPFFNIEKGASNVALNNLKFVGGIFLWGGAITWQGDNGKIVNCDFIDNTARGTNAIGGAVLILGENCSIKDSTFNNNYAYLHGGAIVCNGSGCNIKNCEFNGNVADGEKGHGGAIVLWADNCVISDCEFANNHCTDYGGAISVLQDDNKVVNCKFDSNYVSDSFDNEKSPGGGAIFSASNGLIIDNCNFTANKAPKAYGGAISLSENDTLKNSFFKDNDAVLGNDLVYYCPNVISNTFVIDYNETTADAIYGIPVQELLDSNNKFDKIKLNSSVKFSAGVIFEYGHPEPIHVTVEGGTIEEKNIRVLNHREANITFVDNELTVYGLGVGDYVLRVTTTPDENHTAVDGDLNITVKKATAVISGSKVTVALKSGSAWTITVVDSKDNKPIANTKVSLKIYTGTKYKIVNVTTNDKGVASFKTKDLAAGSHKVEVSLNHDGYNFNTLTSSIKVVKQTALKYKLQSRVNGKGGSLLSYLVLNKKTGKGINGIKIKVLIYTGKTYKTYTLKTKKIKSNKKTFKGAMGFSTNDFSAGKHKVIIKPANIKYKGSVTTYIKIKKSATKGPKFFRQI